MRELSFRIWDKKEKTMFLSPIEIEHLGSWFDAHLSGAIADTGNKIVMQCVGIKDKNGTEIYEGDIVEFLDWKPKEVVWGNKIDKALSGCCGYMLDGTMHFLGENETYLIIGNIHDNPELVKEELK